MKYVAVLSLLILVPIEGFKGLAVPSAGLGRFHSCPVRAVGGGDFQGSHGSRTIRISALSAVSNPEGAENLQGSIDRALDLLVKAAETKQENSEAVCDALESLEQNMRKKCKEDSEGYETARQVLNNLDGQWRLIFTTGTKETQKRFGRKVNYFPLKAMQTFDVQNGLITNGIYFGDTAVLKFFGEFEFNLKSRKLEFDFDKIAVLGLEVNLPKGKAAEIGSASGLGSSNNMDLIKQSRKPFFNWISADAEIATARGGGGGLALWKRVA